MSRPKPFPLPVINQTFAITFPSVLGGGARERRAQCHGDRLQEAIGGKWFLECGAALLRARLRVLRFLGARQEQHA